MRLRRTKWPAGQTTGRRLRPDTGDIDLLLKRSTDGGAAYSSLIVPDDNEAACLYEFSEQRPSEQIVFARFGAKYLTAR